MTERVQIPLLTLCQWIYPQSPETVRTWVKRGWITLERPESGRGVLIRPRDVVGLLACRVLAELGLRGRGISDVWEMVQEAFRMADRDGRRAFLIHDTQAGTVRTGSTNRNALEALRGITHFHTIDLSAWAHAISDTFDKLGDDHRAILEALEGQKIQKALMN